jgi:hypothetical protein
MTNYERILAFPFAQSQLLSRFLLSEMWDKIPIEYRMLCLSFCTAAATEAKDLDQRLRQIKAARQLPG